MTTVTAKLTSTSYTQFFNIGPYTITITPASVDMSQLDAGQLASLQAAAQAGEIIAAGMTQAAFVAAIQAQTPYTPVASGSAPQTKSVSLNPQHHRPFYTLGLYVITTTPQTVDFSQFSKIELENVITAIDANIIQAAATSQADFAEFINGLVAV